IDKILTIFAPNARRQSLRVPSALSRQGSRIFQMHQAEPQRSATKQILIVEDNALNMKLLHDVLEAHGYATITTGEGKTAVSLAREHWPHLVLMDLQLPDTSALAGLAE